MSAEKILEWCNNISVEAGNKPLEIELYAFKKNSMEASRGNARLMRSTRL